MRSRTPDTAAAGSLAYASLAQVVSRRLPELCLVLALLVALYAGIIPEMVREWSQNENNSHGFIIPLIAAYFLWQRRGRLLDAPVAPNAAGLLVLVLGGLMLSLGYLATEYFTMRASLIVILAGLTLALFGTQTFRVVAFPLFFLVFMIPIPMVIYNAVAFPLKLLVSNVSVWVLKAVGVVVLREGNIIMLPDMVLEVADACSGIRSLVSLLALGVAYAAVLPLRAGHRIALVLSAIPIAIVANIIRVIVTGLLVEYVSPDAARGFFHEFAGMAVFAFALALLLAAGALLCKTRGHSIPEGTQ
ncbi:exosortase A [Oceanidesulfovibrio marinus]|uniref:Exosortase/archaeosortase family protein n=1 Tax=Oceanidesulfovibrio marinus TaxID=370038 RepID=A0ABX6ND40_9BACT|nr:exosortase A [Oceanidesulfovibrio marinus]QJT07973.1 exosortase/archaeosortase family protein [Oceanidesulfovibrio marinus]